MLAILFLGVFSVLCACGNPGACAQVVGDYLGDESVLYAETKQVNQFFRRFNGEEGKDGVRFYAGDKFYRDPKMRADYLGILYDGQNQNITPSLKTEFADHVNNALTPVFLNFHGGNWFSEVKAKFLHNGKEETVTLFLKLEKENLGSKWVMTNVYYEPFYQLFAKTDTTASLKFLHPLSHELDFMNLIKVFDQKENLQRFAAKEYRPDYLTLLLYEIKRGNMQFKTVQSVKFHFFQVENWYFELSEFRRSGYNTGWLISNLAKIPEDQKDVLKRYIYGEDG